MGIRGGGCKLAGVTEPVRRLAAEANGQHGVFTRADAARSGVPAHVLRDWVQSGLLAPTGVRSFRSVFVPPSRLSDLSALVADVGAPVLACAITAAALHGFDGFALHPPYHLCVPRGRRLERHGAVIHTTTRLELIDRATVSAIPTTSPTRTVIDLARTQPAARLATAIDSAIRDGLSSEDFLHRRIVALRSSGRYGLPRMLDVLAGAEVTRGGHSWLEREYLRLLSDAGLPRPATQQVLSRRGDRFIRVDCRFPGTPVVVELLGYRFHRSRSQMQVDAERLNRLILDGFAPVQFTYVDVAERAHHCVDTTREALARFV